jgi:hypothetical protein
MDPQASSQQQAAGQDDEQGQANSQQQCTFDGFADLIAIESQKGIIDGNGLMQWIAKNKVPRLIEDVRGDIRLAVDRIGDELLVTQYVTPLSIECFSTLN